MRFDRPTQAELVANFEAALASVCSGGGLNSETGIDMETEAALWAIATAHPHVPTELVAAARTEFAAQLDGSHAAARRAALERRFAQPAPGRDE